MALEVGKAYLQIIPSLKGMEGTLTEELGGEAEKAGKKAGSVLGGAMSVSIGNLATQAISKVASGAMDFVTGSIQAGSDFDKAMAQVAATMGKSVGEIGDLRDFAQQMGASTAFSASEAAEALNYMALAGYDANKSMAALPAVLDLASAGGIALGRASDMVTDAQSALGLSMDETFDMVNQMAMAASKSNTSVEQLGDAMLKIGATARSVKGGTSELATILGVLADNGIKGTEGGTHLRNILLSLQSAADNSGKITLVGEDQEKGIEELSIQLYDAEGNMRSMVAVINDMQKAMAGMTQQEKDVITSGVFNKTDLSSVNALLGTSVYRFAQLRAAISSAEGSATEMAETQLDNLAGDTVAFQSALEGVKITISDALTPTLRDFTKLGTETLQAITQSYKSGGIDSVMDVLGEQLTKGLKLAMGKIPDTISKAGTFVSSILEGLSTLLPQLVSGVLQAAISIIQSLSEVLPQLVAGVLQGVKAILLVLTEGNGLTMILDALASLVTGVVDAVATFLTEDGETVLRAVMDVITTILLKIPEILPLLVDSVANLISAVLLLIADYLPEFFEVMTEATLAMVDGLMDALPQLGSAVGKIMAAILNVIIEHLPEIFITAIQLDIEFMNGMLKAIPKILAAVRDLIFAVLYELQTYIEDIDWAELSANIINGLIDGIGAAEDNLIATVTGAVGKAVDGVKKFLGIASPSKLMRDEIGKYIPEGLALGIEDEQGSVSRAMDLLGSGSLRNVDASIAQSGRGLTAAAFAGAGNTPTQLVAPIYIGDRLLDTFVVEATARNNYRSGGR